MDARQEIMEAVNKSDWESVKQLVGADPGLAALRDASGVSLIMMLAYRGASDAAAKIARYAVPDVFEATALGDAARLKEILAANAGAVEAMSADGWTPLHLAGFFGQTECAKLLLDQGASVSAYSSNAMRNMPLHAALSGRQDAELVRMLLDRGADANAKAATNITPLHLAASRGNQVLIDMLLARGADKAAAMDNGMRPADLARERNFPAVADALG